MATLSSSFRTRGARSGTQGHPVVYLPLGSGFSLREPRNDELCFDAVALADALRQTRQQIWREAVVF